MRDVNDERLNGLGVVALFRSSAGELDGISYIENDSENAVEKKREAYSLEKQGYVLDSMIITNNKAVFYNARLKSALAQLRNYVKQNQKILADLRGKLDDKVVDETERLMHEHEETMMRMVSIRCSRAMFHGVEVRDELALQCYDTFRWSEQTV